MWTLGLSSKLWQRPGLLQHVFGLFKPQNLEQTINQLVQQNHELEATKKSLRKELKAAQDANESLRKESKAARESNESLQKESHVVQEKNKNLNTQLSESSSKFYTLQREKATLGRQVDDAKKETHGLQKQYEILGAEMNRTRHELNAEKAITKHLGERVASLRSMLVPPSEAQVSDSEVVSKFTALRSLTFRFVKGTWALSFKADANEESLSGWQLEFARPFSYAGAPWQTLHSRIRSYIFDVISAEILNHCHYLLNKNSRDLDNMLGNTEDYMLRNLPEGNSSQHGTPHINGKFVC